MTTSNTTRSTPRYYLGTVGNYLFTGLGEFRSGLEAATYWKSQPRSGEVAYIYEARDLSRFGVVFGSTLDVIATVSQ